MVGNSIRDNVCLDGNSIRDNIYVVGFKLYHDWTVLLNCVR